jgi:hypothetical protein
MPWNLRKDQCGKWIDFYDYGDHSVSTGWDVDHKKPKTIWSELEFDFDNLQALNWKDNITKSNKFDFLDKTNHYDLIKENKIIMKNNRRTKIMVGKQYHVYLNAREKTTRIGRIISIDLKASKVLINHDGKNVWVYHDPILFKEY